jgi:hypothetical protein
MKRLKQRRRSETEKHGPGTIASGRFVSLSLLGLGLG